MIKNRVLLLSGVATAGLLSLGCSAMAADIVEPLPPEASWTAFHIGVGGGWGNILHDGFLETEGDFEPDEDDEEDFETFLDFNDAGDESWLATVEAGFDWQAPGSSFVMGIFGDYTWSDFKSSVLGDACNESGDTICQGSDITIKLDNLWTVGGRLGWLSSESTLWYVLGGYSNGKVKTRANVAGLDESEDFPFNVLEVFDESDRIDGFTVGAGVESMLTDNISLKLEGRYTDLGSIDAQCGNANNDQTCRFRDFDDPPDIEVEQANFDFDTRILSIRAVLAWRFNWM